MTGTNWTAIIIHMNEAQEVQNTIDPKLSQFTEELNTLLETYQYVLKVQLKVTADGITPFLAVQNKIPLKKQVMQTVEPAKKVKNAKRG